MFMCVWMKTSIKTIKKSQTKNDVNIKLTASEKKTEKKKIILMKRQHSGIKCVAHDDFL